MAKEENNSHFCSQVHNYNYDTVIKEAKRKCNEFIVLCWFGLLALGCSHLLRRCEGLRRRFKQRSSFEDLNSANKGGKEAEIDNKL
jgi:hypothetical protein